MDPIMVIPNYSTNKKGEIIMGKVGPILATCILTITISGFLVKQNQPVTNNAEKEFYFQQFGHWWKAMGEIFEDPWSSDIGEEHMRKMIEIDRKFLVPLGPKALPYLIVLEQFDPWIGRAIAMISKFEPHNIVLQEGNGRLSTTEEFPHIVERDVYFDARKIFLHWWLKGSNSVSKWFQERYAQWLTLKRKGETNEAKEVEEWLRFQNEPWERYKRGRKLTPFQKLLDIGIAAIPLWVEKLEIEINKSIREAIMLALNTLTDGEIKSTMSPQECLNWWQENKERWTVPFPKSKREFLEWLEKEGWEEQRLAIPCVITISRLEDEGAIDALLRFLRHPSSSVRGKSLEQIMILFGEQLPKEYALGIGTDGWERIGDLMEMGKYDLVRKKLMEAKKKVRDEKVADNIARELSRWWQENRGRVKIYWQRAWEIYH